jgi:hypothetical protein
MCGSIVLLLLTTHQPPSNFGAIISLPPNMFYKTTCLVRSGVEAILVRILASGEADGKGKVMFVKNMVHWSYWCWCFLLITVQRKYKQVIGMIQEEGWVPGIDWIDENTESAMEWREPNGEGDESAIELSEDEADTNDRPCKPFLVFCYAVPNPCVAPWSPSVSSPVKPPKLHARKDTGVRLRLPLLECPRHWLSHCPGHPSSPVGLSVPRSPPPLFLVPILVPSSVTGLSSSNMSTYAIDPDTGVQSTIPAICVVTAPAATTKGKGKGKATTTPAVPTAPMASRVDYLNKPDMEEARKKFLCYWGDRYLTCANSLKLDIPCVNVLNQQLDRLMSKLQEPEDPMHGIGGLMCSHCESRKLAS